MTTTKTNQQELTAAEAIHKATADIRATIVIELAHREALAENIERDTLSNIEETQRMDTEADEREQPTTGEIAGYWFDVAKALVKRTNSEKA